jgi:hypothetical protein
VASTSRERERARRIDGASRPSARGGADGTWSLIPKSITEPCKWRSLRQIARAECGPDDRAVLTIARGYMDFSGSTDAADLQLILVLLGAAVSSSSCAVFRLPPILGLPAGRLAVGPQRWAWCRDTADVRAGRSSASCS